jgi:hypothetical protein
MLMLEFFQEINTMRFSPIILMLFVMLCFDYAAQAQMPPANASESVDAQTKVTDAGLAHQKGLSKLSYDRWEPSSW